MRRSSLDPNANYEVTVLPTVTQVSPNTGNVGGQYLTISGTGFSPNLVNNSVEVDGNNCHVTAASNNEIKCTLGAKNAAVGGALLTNSSAQVEGYWGGAGVSYARYVISGGINSMAKFVAAVRGGDTAALGTPE